MAAVASLIEVLMKQHKEQMDEQARQHREQMAVLEEHISAQDLDKKNLFEAVVMEQEEVLYQSAVSKHVILLQSLGWTTWRDLELL